MGKYRVRGTGKTVDLNQNNFKAKGGEGSIHIIGKTVYKVCEPGKMIPEGKFQELSALNHPQIIKPDEILIDQQNQPVGYTMRLVPGNAMPLAQILTKTYREREGVTPDGMTKLVKQIADGIRFIHKHPDYLQVDGNELNYMVTDDHKSVYFIDVNSYQTPHYPADAIMPSIRDYHCPKDPATGLYLWSHETDWYSFAIISFYMFTAIHPFKGRHPGFNNLKTAMIDQMKACKSVLDPESQFPQAAVYHPFETVIPGGANGAYMRWYRSLFVENKRFPAPDDFQSVLTFAAKIKEISGSNNFNIDEIRQYLGQIVGYFSKNGKDIVVTTENIYVTNQPYSRPTQRFRVGFTPVYGVPVAAWIDNEKLKLQNLETQANIPCDIFATNLMSCDGRLYVKSLKDILEIAFIEQNGSLIASGKIVASVLPNATEMFQGVVFQDMFGNRMASLFPQSGHHRQFRIDELSGLKIIDAKFERSVLMVIGMNQQSGQYNRYIFRFHKDWTSYDSRTIENINPSGLNFTVLDNGICICLTEEEKIEIFSGIKDAIGVKCISDPAVKGDMHLCHTGSQARLAHGDKLYNFSMKK